MWRGGLFDPTKPKLRSERHHWWPECVSEHWADDSGGVNWLLPDGAIRRSSPNNFGVIQNGHHIKLGNDPSAYSPWDENFEVEFQTADSEFPRIIELLETLDRCDPPFERPIPSRVISPAFSDEDFATLVECILSLAVRSPLQRQRAVALAEHYRGPLPQRQRNSLIGMNLRRTHSTALRSLKGCGKALIIFSPEREFIFGDGFFQNLPVNGMHWHSPKILAPITPSISVLYAQPTQYATLPKLSTLVVTSQEVDQINFAVQVYAKDAIFYRSQCPTIDQVYANGKHAMFADDRNAVDQLIYQIPGIPPRDPSFDFLRDRFGS
jgi:Protein of unknown function (DUF4238)